MTRSVDELAKEHAEGCDNESGGFLSHQLEKIREKSFKAGRASLDSEMSQLHAMVQGSKRGQVVRDQEIKSLQAQVALLEEAVRHYKYYARGKQSVAEETLEKLAEMRKK